MYEFINLEELAEAVQKRVDLESKNRIREKMIAILEMLDIDRALLKQTAKYTFPMQSQEFLINLILSFSDSNLQEMRKGNFHNADVKEMKEIIDGFEKMFYNMNLSEREIDQQIMRMYNRTKVPFWEAKKLTQDILKEMIEDLEMPSDEKEICLGANLSGQEIKEAQKKYRARRFHYFEPFDKINVNDELVFMEMMRKDYEELRKRHKAIYQTLSEIRQEELWEEINEDVYKMTQEEEKEAMSNMYNMMAIQIELEKDSRYKELMKEKREILKKNQFIKDLQPKYKSICEEIERLYQKVQKQLFGKVVLMEDTRDGEDKGNQYSNRRNSEQALDEAIQEFEESEMLFKQHQEAIDKISPEQWNQIGSVIDSLTSKEENYNLV